MSRLLRLVVFGLAHGDSAETLGVVIGRSGVSRLQVFDIPGDTEQAFAVLHVQADATQAWRLARRLETCTVHGHRLQAWVPAMPW